MKNIVLFGKPGAGKGTQSEKIIEKYQLTHLSTGDLFRLHLKEETSLGKLAKKYMDEGQLVPDEVVINMVQDKIQYTKHSNGFLFDGFPRTVAQAEALDKMLNANQMMISGMIALEVDDEELVKRLLLRGESSGRADDKDESIIRKRIEVYNEDTAPVADYYKKQGKYNEVYGIGEIEEIFAQLCRVIDQL